MSLKFVDGLINKYGLKYVAAAIEYTIKRYGQCTEERLIDVLQNTGIMY